MRTWAALAQPLAWSLAAGAGALLLAVMAGSGSSPMLGLAIIGGLGVAMWLAWTRQPRRLLIAGLFFLAPIDVSKAIVAPVDRFYSPGLYLTPAHLLVVLLGLLWAGHRWWIERRALPVTRLDVLAGVFFAWICGRTIGTPQGTLGWASVASYGLAVLGFYVVSHALRSASDLRLALQASVVAVGAEFLFVAAQMITRQPLALPGSKALTVGDVVFFGGAGEAFRPTGFFEHPNALADHVCLVVPPALALVLLGRRLLGGHVWSIALGALAAASAMLLATLSRGGWAAALLGAGWVVWHFFRRGLLERKHLVRMAVGGVLGLAAVLAAYPQLLLRLTAPDDRSTESRVILTNQAVTIIGQHPWIGVGYGGYNRAAYETIAPAFANISEEYQQALLQLVVHDHYLLLGAELGVPAVLFFVYLLWRMCQQPRPWGAWRDPTAFALAVGLSGGLVTQVLFLASDNFYADIRIFMIWLVAGTLQALCLQRAADAEAA